MPELMREAIYLAISEYEGETLVEFGQYVSRHAETLLRDAADAIAERRKRARELAEGRRRTREGA